MHTDKRTDRQGQTDRRRQKQYLLARSMRASASEVTTLWRYRNLFIIIIIIIIIIVNRVKLSFACRNLWIHYHSRMMSC